MADVFYDSWAWIESLSGTVAGARLDKRYGPGRPHRIHTSVLAFAEVASRLARRGHAGLIDETLNRMERAAEDRVHPPTVDDARQAAPLHVLLRKDGDASLADALMLAQARRLGLPFISGDKAFRGQKDVLTE